VIVSFKNMGLACVLLAFGSSASQAADFYAGKTVTMVVGSDVGGGFDAYARAMARHLSRHIPGKPTVVVQNMPGAGSARAAGYVYAIAPKDGLTIGALNPGGLLGPLFEGTGNASYEANKFIFIGSADSGTRICITSDRSAVKTFADTLTKKTVMGAAGSGSSSRDYAFLHLHTSDAKFDVVSGYKGMAEIMLAMERSEVDGVCGFDWSSLNAQRPDLVRDKKVNLLVQVGLEPHPELDALNVPKIWDYVKGDENRAVTELVVSQQLFGRPYVVAPGTPAAQVTILRDAFDAVTVDPEFIADATRMKLTVDPASGAKVQAVVEKMYAAPKAILEKAKAAVKP
jgi:tripartite-type tricarboxylate transporter receptor subunit TctC